MKLIARIALLVPVAAIVTWVSLIAYIALSYWLQSSAYPELRCIAAESGRLTKPCALGEYMKMVDDVVFMATLYSAGKFFLVPFVVILGVLIFLQGKYGKADESLDRKFREYQERKQKPPPE